MPMLSVGEINQRVEELRDAAAKIMVLVSIMGSTNPEKQAAFDRIKVAIEKVLVDIEVIACL